MKRVYEETKRKLRERLIKLVNMVFGTIVSCGLVLVFVTQHLEEGIAFIIAGCVGLVMGFLTTDVAKSIKTVIRQDGELTRKVILQDGELTRKVIRHEGKQTRDILSEILRVLKEKS